MASRPWRRFFEFLVRSIFWPGFKVKKNKKILLLQIAEKKLTPKKNYQEENLT
jgi:hypothetical protein